ncbi:hypothetical protein VmeM32_00191 [Vibrio phage vB_VmeM-32]|nr:hypothetical protein VmeM32_00191 [Vibrio phage vB_VmeM-32]
MTNKTTFVQFRDAVNAQFNKLAKTGALYTSRLEKDIAWELYLSAYPEGTNEIYRERAEHDCNCCKSFIRNVGRVLAIVDDKLVSVFSDLDINGEYKIVADKLAKANVEAGITGLYLNDEKRVGKAVTHETLEDGRVREWNHFEVILPSFAFNLNGGVGRLKGEYETNVKSLKRSITELTEYSVETVLDLIADNAIHRGREFKNVVQSLKDIQKKYKVAKNKEIVLHQMATEFTNKNFNCNIRGTAIGTLLVDLSEGMELEKAVKRYEDKVSGTNYKRTTALVTPRMREAAKAKANELGIEPSLFRRFAVKSDVSVNDVLFSDSSVKPFMADSVFDAVPVSQSKPSIDTKKVTEISMEKFIEDVLPNSESIDLLFENKHVSNLVSLVAPQNADAPTIMKWGNNFSFSYNGDYTESVIKQNVKSAGGKVDAPVRISLAWNNHDDLDIHLSNNRDDHVYFANKRDAGFQLDVDMRGERQNQVENIFSDGNDMKSGTYEVTIHNYNRNTRRHGCIEGFEVEMEFYGKTYNFVYDKSIPNGKRIVVAKIRVVPDGSIEVTPSFTMQQCGSCSRRMEH